MVMQIKLIVIVIVIVIGPLPFDYSGGVFSL